MGRVESDVGSNVDERECVIAVPGGVQRRPAASPTDERTDHCGSGRNEDEPHREEQGPPPRGPHG